MRPVIMPASTSASGLSDPVILDQYLTPFNVTIGVELFSASGSNYTVQYSLDDPYATYTVSYNANANWYNHPTLVNLSADASDTFYTPVRACRILTTTVGTGATQTPRMVVIQAGVMG